MSDIQGQRRSRDARFLRNKALAEYLGTTVMTIWRWRRDPKLNFPQATEINGVSYTDLDLVDQWMRLRVVDRAEREVA